jgi:hypothetical protein
MTNVVHSEDGNQLIRIYFIAALILAATYGCFGSVPSYYARDNWKTAAEANKIQIIEKVNHCHSTVPSKFTLDQWKKLRYQDKIGIIDEALRLHKNDGVIVNLPSSFYVKELDLIMLNFITSKDRDNLRNTSIGVTLHAIAAMEGDWGNGEGQCEHAKRYLGEDAFDDFIRLFPDKYNKLCSQ